MQQLLQIRPPRKRLPKQGTTGSSPGAGDLSSYASSGRVVVGG